MAILVFVTASPYEVTSMAVAMMLELKMNEECTDMTLSVAEQEERRRLFWSIFLIDRCGRPLEMIYALPDYSVDMHDPACRHTRDNHLD